MLSALARFLATMPWAGQVERLEVENGLDPLLEVLVKAEDVEEFLLMAEVVQYPWCRKKPFKS